jgi:hypothetical protein
MKRICLLAAAAVTATTLIVGAACAHSWNPYECCHNKDCRPGPCEELRHVASGIQWLSQALFSDAQIKPSPDGKYHIWLKSNGDFVVLPICVFVP